MNLTNIILLVIVFLLIFISKKLVEILNHFPKHDRDYIVDEDPLFDTALKITKESDFASASLLQRRLNIGYARAARLLDQLEEGGYVGPAIGSKPREVYKK